MTSFVKRTTKGERITITKHGKPVARLVPIEPDERPDVKQLVAEMLAYRDQKNRTLGDTTVRELIEEGRR